MTKQEYEQKMQHFQVLTSEEKKHFIEQWANTLVGTIAKDYHGVERKIFAWSFGTRYLGVWVTFEGDEQKKFLTYDKWLWRQIEEN